MLHEDTLFWLAVGCQLLGWTAMLVSRLNDRLINPQWARAFFLAAFCLVGACAGFIFCCHTGHWLASGITFGGMAVGATLDFSPQAETAPF